MTDSFEQSTPVPSRNMRRSFGCIFVGAVLMCGFVAAILFFVFGTIRNSEATRLAFAEAQADPAVVEAIGEPMTMGYFVSGSISITNDEGEASLIIPIAGTRGRGTINAQLERVSGEDWFVQRLVVDVENGDRIFVRE